MHRKVAEVFEIYYKKNLDEVVFSLAHHFTIGKEIEKARLYSEKAGDKSARLYAMDEAIKYYEWALAALAETEESYEVIKKKAEMLTKIGDLCHVISNWQSALDYYRKLVKLTEGMGEKIKTGEAYRKIGESLRQMGNFDEARNAFEEGLKISEGIKDLRGISESHRGLGYLNWRRGEHDRAIAHYNVSLQNSMKSGDIHTIARTFIDLGNVYNYKGELEKATEYYQKGLDQLNKIGDVYESARAYLNLGDIGIKQKNYDKAISYLEKAREYGEKIGSRFHIAWAFFNGAEALARKGDLKKAREYSERSLRIMERIGNPIGMQGLHRTIGLINRLEKKWVEAEASLNVALKVFEGRDMPFETAEVYFEMGLLHRDKGEVKDAIENLKKAEAIYSEIGSLRRSGEVRKELESLGQ